MTITAPPEYEALKGMLRELDSLQGIQEILVWDELVLLPKRAVSVRAKQKAALAAVIHEKATGKELGDAISAAEKASNGMNAYSQANIRDARRNYEHKIRIPRDLVMKREHAESVGYATWVEAKSKNNWDTFAPVMRNGLNVFKAVVSASRPNMDSYDAALDYFERGMTADRLQELFEELAPPLKNLFDRVAAARENMPPIHPALIGGEGWSVTTQTKFSHKIAEVLSFDLERGRLDVSEHPFTGGSGPDDTRVTTRYSEDKPFEGIMGTVHEVGHGFYMQGRNGEQKGLPVSEVLSMGADESQSLFWERMVAQSRSFWQAVLPIVHDNFPLTKGVVTADDLTYAVNQVDPKGLIRVDADELSYPFHIMIRFEIERALFDGTMDVDELPKIWNEQMKKYFDVDVPDHAHGCLQDVHWSSLFYGYFPSYALGAMAAAQLYTFMDKEGLPGMEERISCGHFKEIKEYLNHNFHKLGSLHTSLDDLLISVTGEPLKVSYFMEYLTKKYCKMYNLN